MTLLGTIMPAGVMASQDLHHGHAEPGLHTVSLFQQATLLCAVHKLPHSTAQRNPPLVLFDGLNLCPQNGTQLEITLNNPNRS